MTPSPSTVALAQTAVARLCHDLAGGVGTIDNALELAAGGGDIAAEALALAAEASRELTLRLRMARLMWVDETASVGTVLGLAEGLPGRRRVRLERSGLAEAMLPAATARLLACLLLLASESLNGSGRIVFAGDPACEIRVSIEGPRAAWPAVFVDRLAKGSEPAVPDPATLVSYLALLAAVAAGAQLSLADAASGARPLVARLNA